MPRWLKRTLQTLVQQAPLEIRRWLPVIGLEPLDLILANYGARGKMVTIVQVGACDGSTNDPIFHHVAAGSARAILIEPNPFAFDRLQKSYRDVENVTLVQAAIAERDGEAHFYRIKKTDKTDSEADWSLQLASFYREHLERHGVKPERIERITVRCRSLSSLVDEFVLNTIDLLQIDAEGFDAAVVRMALKLAVRPNCINFEHRHLKPADRRPLFELLKANDYLFSYDEWNLLALQRRSLEELKLGGTQLAPNSKERLPKERAVAPESFAASTAFSSSAS